MLFHFHFYISLLPNLLKGKKNEKMKRIATHSGMATGWVRARFFHTRTQPTGLPRKPGPNPFIKQIFFLTPNLPRRALVDPVPSCLAKPKIRDTNFDL